MEKLKKTFVKYGYQFKQIKRKGMIAVYEQSDADDGKLIAYEVFEIQEFPDQLVGPKKYPKPAREARPGSESWGRLGFTCRTKEAADKRFEELQLKYENRKNKK